MTVGNNYISVVVPAYNESENLPFLVKNVYEIFNKSKFINNYEVVVVNDGSIDNTENVVKDMLSHYKNLTLINLKENVGKAYSLDSGLKISKGNIIATMDADLQYSPEDLIKMLEKIESGYDLVNGRRTKRQDIFFTKIFSNIYNLILRILFRTKIQDFFSGIKVFKKEIYSLMGYKGLSRFVIFFSKKYNFKISEINIEHKKRKHGVTAYSFFDRIILSLKDIFTLLICVALEKKGVYQIKQVFLSIYFLTFLFLILGKFVFNYFNLIDVFYLLTSFSMLSMLNLIIQSFLDSKERKNIETEVSIRSVNTSHS
jgi:dolichol-phosphate mannosyltransferase